MNLHEVIRKTRDEYLQLGLATSYAAINSGLCEDFAVDVIGKLPGGLRNKEVADVSVASFQVIDESEDDPYHDGRPFDKDMLREYWPMVTPPAGLSWECIDQLSVDAGFGNGTHVWITYQGLHYDAECPDGVANFFELPFFQRIITGWNEK